MLTKPDTTFRQLFMSWHKHPVLKEYERPSYEVVRRLWRVSRQVIKEEYVRKYRPKKEKKNVETAPVNKMTTEPEQKK